MDWRLYASRNSTGSDELSMPVASGRLWMSLLTLGFYLHETSIPLGGSAPAACAQLLRAAGRQSFDMESGA